MLGRVPVSVRSFAFVAALAFTAVLGACATGGGRGSGKTIEPGVLKVCLYPGFAPFSYKDEQGQWAGWDISYLQNFAKREKLAFQPVEVADFNGIWNLAGQGKCDIAASGISDLAERRKETGKAGTWSQHYYRVVRSFAVRAADQGKLNGVEDLRDKTAIVTGGSTADNDLRNRSKIAGIQSVTIETTTDEEEAAIKVRDGGGVPFAYGGGLGSIELLVQKLGGLAVAWPHCNMLADGTQVDEPFSFVVRAKSAGLAADLDRYIAKPDAPYEGGPGPDLKCPPSP
jgi:membrane-bound lytic murein transglycosylase MltF